MEIAKIILTVIFIIAALAIITIVLLQEGKSAGLGSIGGSSSNAGGSYWDKNKKHSLEGKFETWTKITAGIFVVLGLVIMFLN